MIDKEQGAVPVLAVFLIFGVIIAATALIYIRTASRSRASAIRKLTAVDITRARSSAIEFDLNEALETSVTAAMWEVGMGGGARKEVEAKVRGYLNARIDNGWDFDAVDVIVPRVNENNLKFEWQPDGSVIVHGLLDAEIRHINGPIAHGIRIYSQPVPRFQRLKKVAELLAEKAETAADLEGLEAKANENYRGEGIYIKITKYVEVTDNFGAKTVILPG